MKELSISIEEKAKAYDEALDYACYLIKERCKEGTDGSFHRADLQKMFPELKESDDERIRKELIEFVKSRGGFKQEYIAWLEKQDEQKPVEWSGEDEDRLEKLVWELEQKKRQSELGLSTGYSPKFWEETIMWLKSFKGRCFPQPKPEWSEEDERLFEDIEEAISKSTWGEYDKKLHISFLKHLRPQSKQGEQKPADKVEPKFKAGDCIKPIDSCLGSQRTICEVCDGWYVTNQGTLDFEYENNWELVEQKPAWSEEDDKILGKCIDAASGYYSPEDKQSMKYWLKSLKDRVQPKQEWSDEDEKLYNDLSDTYFYNDEDYPEETYKLMLKRVLDWMTKRAKSLRPQNRWKPSDEQMHYLSWVANVKLGDSVVEQEVSKHLNELYTDLKKLKDEK